MSKKPSFGILRPPAPRPADYLQTLHEWGALPEIVPIPDAVGLLARLTKQNQAALARIVSNAVLDQEIRYWGLSHSGDWQEGMIRFFHTLRGKPRVRPATANRPEEFALEAAKDGRLHIEAMGVCPVDLVALLERRGRKVPDELKALIPDDADATAPAKTTLATGGQASDSDDQGMPKKKSAWPAWLVEKAWKDADDIALKRYNSGQGKFSARSIAPDIAALWREDESTWGKGEPRGEGDIRNNGLKGWRFVPPAGKNGRIGKTGKEKMAR